MRNVAGQRRRRPQWVFLDLEEIFPPDELDKLTSLAKNARMTPSNYFRQKMLPMLRETCRQA